MSTKIEDYYKILGVQRNATDKEIQKAYRKLAHQYHPDSNKSKEAEERFKKINEAYNILKDPEKKKAYDQFGHSWEQGQGFNTRDYSGWSGDNDILRSVFESIFRANNFGRREYSNFGSNFGGFDFNHSSKGEDIHTEMDVSIIDAYYGGTKQIRLATQGSDGFAVPKILDVNIPKGIGNGKKIRLRGQGNISRNGGPKGDLIIKINIVDDAKYHLKGNDIYVDLKISPWEAVLGDSIQVETFGKMVQIKIPENTQEGQKFRIKGKGLIDKKQPGDLYLVARISLPKEISNEEEKLLRKWKKLSKFNPRG